MLTQQKVSKRGMEIMQFVLGLFVGLIAGFISRGWLNKIEIKLDMTEL